MSATTDGATTTTTPPAASTTPPTTVPGSPSPSWHDALPEGLKHDKTLREFKDPATLGQSYIELKKWQSGAIRVPGADAKPEEWAPVFEKLGKPKTPEGYHTDAIKGFPGADSPERAGLYRKAHDLNLTTAQVEGLIPWAFEREQAVKAQRAEAFLQEHDKLADEWGKAVYDRRVQLVQRLVGQYATDEERKYLDDTGYTNDPKLFVWLSRIAERTAEHRIIDPMTTESTGSPEQIQQKIADLTKQIDEENKKAGETPRLMELVAARNEEYKKLYPSR